MLPARIPEGKAPRIMAFIDDITFPLLLDTGGEVSVGYSLWIFSVVLTSLLNNLLVVVLFLLSEMEWCNYMDLFH